MQIWQNQSLKKYSTFDIGGEASYLISVTTEDEMRKAFDFALKKQLPFYVIGNGSNILFSQPKLSCVIIHNQIQKMIQEDEKTFYFGAGCFLPNLSRQTVEKKLSGLEFALGIPATLGGAIFMNASAQGQSISEPLLEVEFMTENGQVRKIEKKDLAFGYRFSTLQNLKGAILGAKMFFHHDILAKEKQKEFIEKRRKSQPLNSKSIGCIFKNPEKYSAGYLIESCGLKGFSIHDAEISTVHANFIINRNQATAKDVLDLIEHVKRVVLEKTNIQLEEEICLLPPT